ncbi:MAG: amino acid dehydrogenase, partial [Bacteroidota bacterium]|nr:amino acid dehydrogenase [Bacteroidota bacterium]MDX5431142.1 amino acid dehydrogenase [Bacteroidota bacterium]MDX5469889.1 amino acid dehydrogenase [Bacteroidota bacterium]
MYHQSNFETLLAKYEHKEPEIVFEWHDSETEAVGWVVINSLRGGAAGGGTRMRKGLDKHEVESLAKTMEIKFTICGPAIGGAKSGINFDPNDPRKKGVLERWYKAVYPLLKNYYGTGGDLNVDEIHEVIPITSSYGLLHPQEGVVNGHIRVEPAEVAKRIKQLQDGVLWNLTDARFTPDTSGKYTVADMITGWGVSEAIRHYYDIYGGQLAGKRAIVQGWGNVAAAAAYYQAQLGVKVVGIIDREGGLINEKGFSFEEIKQLFIDKDGNKLKASNMLSFEEVNDKIWEIGAEIMIPAAASRLLTKEQINKMAAHDLEVISCGANVPFADQEIFFGPIAAHADSLVSILPDFIANCGMARVFAYLMGENAVISDEA